MKTFRTTVLKTIVFLIAIINIVVMMAFQYGLPSYAGVASGQPNTGVSESVINTEEIGTIESVEKEEATKETEAADSAIAKHETEQKEEPDEEERDPDAPVLELTDDHIYLKVGERFNYMSYIKTMKDVDGSDLSRYIYLNKYVDTSEPGEIELTYRITSTITGKTDSKVLLITIQDLEEGVE